MKLTSTNPSRGYQIVGEVEVSTPEEVAAKVALAHKAKQAWQDLGIAGRVAILRKVGQRFVDNRDRMIKLQAEEMGMAIKEVEMDFDGTVGFWNSYLDGAEEALKPTVTINNEHEVHELHRVPRGVVACIVPWNFPFAN